MQQTHMKRRAEPAQSAENQQISSKYFPLRPRPSKALPHTSVVESTQRATLENLLGFKKMDTSMCKAQGRQAESPTIPHACAGTCMGSLEPHHLGTSPLRPQQAARTRDAETLRTDCNQHRKAVAKND